MAKLLTVIIITGIIIKVTSGLAAGIQISNTSELTLTSLKWCQS